MPTKTTTFADVPSLLSVAGISVPRWASDAVKSASLRYDSPTTDHLAKAILSAKTQQQLDQAGREFSEALAHSAFADSVNAYADQRSQTILAAAFSADRMEALTDLVKARYVDVSEPFVRAADGVVDVVDVSAQDITADLLAQRDAMAATGAPLRRVRSVWLQIAPLAGIDLSPSTANDLGSELLSMASFTDIGNLEAAAETVSRHRRWPQSYLYSAYTPELAVVLHGGTFRLADGELIDDDRVQLFRGGPVAV